MTRGYLAPHGANGHITYTSPSRPSNTSDSAPQPCGGAKAKSTISGRSGYGPGRDPRPHGSSLKACSATGPTAASNTCNVPSERSTHRCPSLLGCHAARSGRIDGCLSKSSSSSGTHRHPGAPSSNASNPDRSPPVLNETMASAEDGGMDPDPEDASCLRPPTAAKCPEGETEIVRGSKSIGGSGLKTRVGSASSAMDPRAAALRRRAGHARITPSAPSA